MNHFTSSSSSFPSLSNVMNQLNPFSFNHLHLLLHQLTNQILPTLCNEKQQLIHEKSNQDHLIEALSQMYDDVQMKVQLLRSYQSLFVQVYPVQCQQFLESVITRTNTPTPTTPTSSSSSSSSFSS
ncbi:hypothetical protein HMI56_005561 [Coelomomyces lativittatus]|nr:hypothetical protein HMI56_005561 [Coelomomyces lativittatus]